MGHSVRRTIITSYTICTELHSLKAAVSNSGQIVQQLKSTELRGKGGGGGSRGALRRKLRRVYNFWPVVVPLARLGVCRSPKPQMHRNVLSNLPSRSSVRCTMNKGPHERQNQVSMPDPRSHTLHIVGHYLHVPVNTGEATYYSQARSRWTLENGPGRGFKKCRMR